MDLPYFHRNRPYTKRIRLDEIRRFPALTTSFRVLSRWGISEITPRIPRTAFERSFQSIHGQIFRLNTTLSLHGGKLK
jgi:hypothetical protein